MKRAETTNTLSLPDWLEMMIDPGDEMQHLISELSEIFAAQGQSYEHFMSFVHMNHADSARMLRDLWTRIDTDIEHRYMQDHVSKYELINWHQDVNAYRALMHSLLYEYEQEHKQAADEKQLLVEAA